ncbi:hypothetical protein FACS189463_1710 [Bacteroidia bacterium]|nr:hypothetical protein FACS189463_1710 [Bacteroidia bacterium]
MLSSPQPAGNKGKTPLIIAGAVIAVAIIAVAGILIGKSQNSSSNDYQTEAYQPAPAVQPSSETPLVVNQPEEVTPPETVYAYINGTKVIMRASHSTTSSKLGFFDEGEKLQILDEYTPSNSDEAITNTKVNLYNSYGEKIYVLPKGKAVKILSKNEGKIEVQFYHSKYGNLTATVSSLDLESIAGEKWYKVKRYSGETGWVFSKFVNKLR